MDLTFLPSGIHAVWADARQFLAGVRFTRPDVLWLSVLPLAIALVSVAFRRSRRGAERALGLPSAVAAQVVGNRRPGRLSRLAIPMAWLFLILGAAGPRWGIGEDEGVAVGRDVVIVLDLSRSMLADDTTSGQPRWQLALAGAEDLIDALQKRGGHRAALLVFASKPKLLVPLTTDYNHLLAKLHEIDGANPPPEVRPGDDGPASGTRIGAALAAAVQAHDPRFPGYQDIILLSDGDDPLDDREWTVGVSAVRNAKIPVHVVGLGDPNHFTPLRIDDRIVEGPGPNGVLSPVQTKLREDELTALAAEGKGQYLPARRDVPRLGEFFRSRIEPNPSRELTDDALPQPKDHSAWFLGIGLLLLTIGWVREK